MRIGRSWRNSGGSKTRSDNTLMVRVFCGIANQMAGFSCTLKIESNLGKLCHVHSSDYAEVVRQIRAD